MSRIIFQAIVSLVLFGWVAGCETLPAGWPMSSEVEARNQSAIHTVLEDQVAAWNRGDMEGYVQAYWQSNNLRFMSGGTVQRGFDGLLKRYRQAYPDPVAMGQVSFTDIEIDFLGPEAAVAHGAWALKREEDSPSGLFTLILRRIDGTWVIVSDTTTSAD